MNKYQKIAFGAFAVLVFAFMIASLYNVSGLGLMVVLALVVALLTLPTTWKIIFGFVQGIGAVIAFTGHSVGKIGDVVADAAFTQRQGLSTSMHGVPDWDSPHLVKAGSNSPDEGIDALLEPHPAS